MALAVCMGGMPASAQSLADTLIAAYRNSNLLDQNRAVLRAADEDVAIAVSTLRPVLEFVSNARSTYTSSPGPAGNSTVLLMDLGLQGSVTIFDFGRGRLGRDAAEAQVLAARQALVDVEQQVMLNAVVAFMDVRTATEFVSLNQANLRVIDQELSAARERFELGEITRTDVSLAEARLAASRSQLAAAEGDLAAAREAYKFATGAYPGQLRPPPTLPRTATSLQAAQDIARLTHPNILQAQHLVRFAEIAAEIAFAQRHGTVSGTANVGRQFNNRTDGANTAGAGINFSRPIYTGGRLSAEDRRANARRDEARARLHQTVAQVLQTVAVAWANIDVARARIAASQQQVNASESAFEGTREEARLGARTTLDVLNAETDLLDARTTLLQAQAAQQIATYNLLSAMGLLTVEHLNLGIPTYDPEAYFNAVRNAPAISPQGEALDRVLRSIGRE